MGDQATGEFAAAVQELKRRSGLSYGALARKLHLSTSTLHRYCSGAAVPVEYAPIERLARACHATSEDHLELHRLWVLADAQRRRARASGIANRMEPPQPVPGLPVSSAPRQPAADHPELPPATAPDHPVPDAADGHQSGDPRRQPTDDSRTPAAPPPAGPIPAGPPQRRRARPSRPLALALSVALLGVLLLAGAALWRSGGSPASDNAPSGATGPSAVPLEWTTRSELWLHDCSHRYLVDRDPARVPPPPAVQDAEPWADDLQAVHNGRTIVETTLRPVPGGSPVVIEAMYVRVTGRAEPLPWNVYLTAPGCGGSLSVAGFTVDLDDPAPRPVPADGYDGQTDRILPAPSLPYQVTETEPLSLRVTAETDECDCRWALDIEWSSGTERGTLRVDNDGVPFRTSGSRENDSYAHLTGSWEPFQE